MKYGNILFSGTCL